jgi:nascent polypeptide-associated complex subunit beta
VSGNVETKHVYELLPGIVNQLSPELLQKLSAAMQGPAGGAGASAPIAEGDEDEDDEEIPDLVENFEETANK